MPPDEVDWTVKFVKLRQKFTQFI